MPMSRDKTIDRLRGFAMFWVIVVHVLYWGNFFTNGYVNLLKSFCLFEMPLFFFITGASNSFSKTKNYFDFVIKRFQRILIPYWVFAFICAVLSIVKYAIDGNMDFITSIKVLLSWMIPINRQMTSVPYLTWALWFITVYLCIVLIIPVLKTMKQSTHKYGFSFLLLGLFVLTCLFNMGWVQNISFYAMWTYIGLFYNEITSAINQKHIRKNMAFLFAAGAAAICMLYFAGQPLDMQVNKFPPNIIFFVFSVMMMAAIILAIPCLNRIFDCLEKSNAVNKIFALFSTRSMTIFLYQVFAFNLTIRLANKIIPGSGIIVEIIKSAICLAATVPVCAGMAIIFGKIENVRICNAETTHKIVIELFRSNKEVILYLFFGICTTAINTICYGILHDLLLINNILSTILAWLAAVVFAFVTNKAFVFESKRNNAAEQLSEITSFFGCRILTGILDVVIMAVAVDYLKWNSLLWKLISNIIVTIINYIASKFFIFKDKNAG